MKNDRYQIYESDYWKDVIRPTIIKRDKGICQICHKLILRKWTIHHIIELTDENYTDPKIAYGLDNLILVCSKCHNKLHPEKLHKEIEKQTIVNDDLTINYSKRKETK